MMCRWKSVSLLAAVWLATAIAAEPRKGLFRVTASTDTGLFPTGWWSLEIREDGTAQLTGDDRVATRFTVERERVESLRKALRDAFTLYPQQGVVCIDCP